MKKALFIVSVSLAFVACKKGTTEVVCNPPATVSFKNDIQPIFNANCNTSGCHSGNKPAGNLNLESANAYANLMDSKSGYIDLLHPENSILYVSITSKTNPMPPSGKLDECVTGLILKWIQQGAKNN
jgi:hypothetical protein